METVDWFWVVIVLTWLPIGYLVSRLDNATSTTHLYRDSIVLGECDRQADHDFNWNRPVTTTNGWRMFGVVTLFGWFSFVIALGFVFLITFVELTLFVLDLVGKVLAPR